MLLLPLAELPESVLLMIVNVPSSLKMAPPPPLPLVELPLSVLLMIVSVPKLATAPPMLALLPPLAELPLSVLLAIVSVPPVLM